MDEIKAGLIKLLRGCVERGNVDGYIGAKELATLVDVFQRLEGPQTPQEVRFVLEGELENWAK